MNVEKASDGGIKTNPGKVVPKWTLALRKADRRVSSFSVPTKLDF